MNRKQRRLFTKKSKNKDIGLLKGVEPIQLDKDLFCRLHFPITAQTPKSQLDKVRFKPVFGQARWGNKRIERLICPLCSQTIQPYKPSFTLS